MPERPLAPLDAAPLGTASDSDTPTSESAIQQAILLDLGARQDLRIWRQNTGVGRAPNGRIIRFAQPGTADILGVLCIAPGLGRFVALEVKSATGRQSAEQQAWGAMIRRFGGFYAVVRSVIQARSALAEARREAIEAARSVVHLLDSGGSRHDA